MNFLSDTLDDLIQTYADTVADGDQLELYCLNESLMVQCWKEIKAVGIEKLNGMTTAATHQLNKCMDRRLKMMAELGLTTSSRTRLSVASEEENDPFLEYLAASKKLN